MVNLTAQHEADVLCSFRDVPKSIYNTVIVDDQLLVNLALQHESVVLFSFRDVPEPVYNIVDDYPHQLLACLAIQNEADVLCSFRDDVPGPMDCKPKRYVASDPTDTCISQVTLLSL